MPETKQQTEDHNAAASDEPATHDLANSQDLQNCSWPQLMDMFSSALREHEQLDHDLQAQAADLLKVRFRHSLRADKLISV